MTRTSEHRKHIPVSVKLHAVLLLLGFTDEEITQGQIQWDHDPALGLREVIDGRMVPNPNDPRFIRPLRVGDHDTKTNGKGGEKRVTTYGSDKHAMRKTRNLTRQQVGEARPKRKLRGGRFRKGPKKVWPKRRMSRRRT